MVENPHIVNQSLIIPGAVISRPDGPPQGRGGQSGGICHGAVQLAVHVNGINVIVAAFGHGARDMMPLIVLHIGLGFDFGGGIVTKRDRGAVVVRHQTDAIRLVPNRPLHDFLPLRSAMLDPAGDGDFVVAALEDIPQRDVLSAVKIQGAAAFAFDPSGLLRELSVVAQEQVAAVLGSHATMLVEFPPANLARGIAQKINPRCGDKKEKNENCDGCTSPKNLLRSWA